ncbi:MAG: preprotein translocase subunit YajC [Aristaeellaceae bacterium]
MELFYKLLGIATAAAEEVAATDTAANMTAGQSILYMLLQLSPILIMVVLMYFIMIRPERKRRKKEKAMLDALKRGDRVCTIGGIYGTIMDIKDDTITLSVGRDNLSMVVARWAIRSVEDVTIENESESLN